MTNKRSFFPIFLIFFFLSIIIFFLSSHHLLFGENFLENMLFPVQAGIFKAASLPGGLFQNKELAALQRENQTLRSQLVTLKKLQEDNAALQDQFATTSIPSQHIIPAEIIGKPQFIPGINQPENLVVDKGSADGVSIGNTVIYTTNLVGTVLQVTEHAALVTLASNTSLSFTSKTATTNTQGVLTGQGNGMMVLGNVLLSDTLKIGDTVITSGSQNISAKGFPPGLIVGKIISVSKTPSSLYQSASVQSLLSLKDLTMVFVMK